MRRPYNQGPTIPHDQAYLEAEKKVEEALQLGSAELDFYYLKMSK